jgi:hypothetical protein
LAGDTIAILGGGPAGIAGAGSFSNPGSGGGASATVGRSLLRGAPPADALTGAELDDVAVASLPLDAALVLDELDAEPPQPP